MGRRYSLLLAQAATTAVTVRWSWLEVAPNLLDGGITVSAEVNLGDSSKTPVVLRRSHAEGTAVTSAVVVLSRRTVLH